MDLIKIEGGQPVPYSLDQFRQDNPNVVPGAITEDFLAKYDVYIVSRLPKPEGLKVEPSPNVDLVNGRWVRGWVEVPVTKEDVQQERDRRVLAGSTFTVAGYPIPIRLAGDPQTTGNMQARVANAILAQQKGVTGAVFAWRDEDNVVHNLTPSQFLELFNQASMYVDFLYQKSWALIDNPPIPEDYQDDKYWT